MVCKTAALATSHHPFEQIVGKLKSVETAFQDALLLTTVEVLSSEKA